MKNWTLAFLLLVTTADPARAGSREDDLLQAVRAGDAAAVKALLDQGVPADTKFRYDRTALSFAADRGNVGIVRLLLERGANADAQDSFYDNTSLGWAAYRGHVEVLKLLLAKTVTGAPGALMAGVLANKPDVVDAVLGTGKVGARDLSYALQAAEKNGATDLAARMRKAGAVPPPRADATVDPAVLARYAGLYREEAGEDEITLSVADGSLHGSFGGRSTKLGAIDATRFQHLNANGWTLEMRLEGDRVIGVTLTRIGSEQRYRRVEEAKP